MTKQVAIITGAANGIGLAAAQRLAEKGFHVVVADVNEAGAMKAADDLRHSGMAATGLALDVGNPAQIGKIPELLGPLFDEVTVLVNNAGVSPKKNGRKVLVDEITLEEWERVLRVNLTGPLLLSQLVHKPMRKKKWGRILNISSRSGRFPSGLTSVGYIVTKTGILGLTRSLAQEFAEDNITVNSIAPGRFETPMGVNLDKASMAKILEDVPLKRWGKTEEIGALIGFLASDDAAYITGAVIDINGGVLMI